MYIFSNQHITFVYAQLADAMKSCDVLALPYNEIEQDDRYNDEPLDWIADCMEQDFSIYLYDVHDVMWLEYNTTTKQWIETIDEIAQNTYSNIEINRLLHQIHCIVVDYNDKEIYITATSEWGYTHE